MLLETEKNPNCQQVPLMSFDTLSEPSTIDSIRCDRNGKMVWANVIGVDQNGRFVAAVVQKISDSGDGFAFLIYGGLWGIRLRPEDFSGEPWDLANPHQWGEPYLVYGDAADLRYSK